MSLAQTNGYQDHLAGQFELPPLFANDPQLTLAWKDGQEQCIWVETCRCDEPADRQADSTEDPSPGSDWRGSL